MAWTAVSEKSVRGDQVLPPSAVRQTPPVSAAANMTLGSLGSTAMPLSRPVAVGAPGDWPAAIGAGPMLVQVNPLSGIELDGRARRPRGRSARRARPGVAGPRRGRERVDR